MIKKDEIKIRKYSVLMIMTHVYTTGTYMMCWTALRNYAMEK